MLAGGSGTRLRPITYTSAKQLVPLANTPILFFGLEAIASAGITEVGIVVGDTHEEIRAVVGDGSRFGLRITYLRQDAPLGLAHAVLISRDFLGDEPFVMYLGDNLVVGGIDEYAREFEHDRPEALLLLAKVDHPEQFGVAELDADGELVGLVEKPAEPPSDLALVGVYFFDRAIHEAVRAIAPSGRGELEITDAIGWLVEHKRTVRTHVLSAPWIDTGKLTDLLEANRIVLGGLVRDVRGEVDDASMLTGAVVIEAGAEICEQHRARSRDRRGGHGDPRLDRRTVHLDRSALHDHRIRSSSTPSCSKARTSRVCTASPTASSDSGARVVRSDEQPLAYRLLVADHSDIRVR